MTTGYLTNKIKELKTSRYPYWYKTNEDFQILGNVWFKTFQDVPDETMDVAFDMYISKDDKKKFPSPDDIKKYLRLPAMIDTSGFSEYYISVKDIYSKTMPSGSEVGTKTFNYDYALFCNWMGSDILKHGGTRMDIENLNYLRVQNSLPKIRRYTADEIKNYMIECFGLQCYEFTESLKEFVRQGDIQKIEKTVENSFRLKLSSTPVSQSRKDIGANDDTLKDDSYFADTGFITTPVSEHYIDEF